MTEMTSKHSHCKTYVQKGSTICAIITQVINNEGIIILCCLEGTILCFTVPARSITSKPVGNTNEKNVLVCSLCLQVLDTVSLLHSSPEGYNADSLTAS